MEPLITEAIVVRLVDHGEADRVATLLTRTHGKVGALARGVRRSRRRFGGMEPFAVGEATIRRRRGELWSLEGFHPAPGSQVGTGADVAVVAHAAYLCELARELVPDEAADPRVFALLASSLARLAAAGAAAWRLRAFEAALLDAVGLAPSLDRCVGCGGSPPARDPATLDARRGGVLCGACAPSVTSHPAGPAPPRLSPAVRLAIIATAARAIEPPAAATDGEAPATAEEPALARLSPDDARAARDALQALLHEHLRRPLRSLEFIAKLNADAARARTSLA